MLRFRLNLSLKSWCQVYRDPQDLLDLKDLGGFRDPQDHLDPVVLWGLRANLGAL
jgi:hypothetical protein